MSETALRRRNAVAEQKNGLEGYFMTKGSKKLVIWLYNRILRSSSGKAATWMLLSQKKIEKIDLLTPRGILLHPMPLDVCFDEQQASCAIRKDGGDDPDATRWAAGFMQSYQNAEKQKRSRFY